MVEDAPRNQILFFLLSIVLFCFFLVKFSFFVFPFFYMLFLYLLMFVILFFWSITCRGMWERGTVGSNTHPSTSVPLAYQLSYVGGLLYFFFVIWGVGEGGDRTPPLQATPSIFFRSKPSIIFLSTMFVILLG